MAVKCVVLDFDGVLVDSNSVKRNAFFEIFSSFENVHHLIQRVLETRRDGDRFQIISGILEQLICVGYLENDLPVDQLVGEYAERYNEICEHYAVTCRETAGASESLAELAKQYTLYVNSATPVEPLRRIVQKRGWTRFFRDILGRSRTKVENIESILNRERIDASQVAFVGDGRNDLEAALICGCWFIGMRSDGNDFNTKGIDMLNSLSDLKNVFERYTVKE